MGSLQANARRGLGSWVLFALLANGGAWAADNFPNGTETAEPVAPADMSTNGQTPQRAWLVPGPPPGPKEPGWFHLDRLDGYLEIEAFFEQQRRQRGAGGWTDGTLRQRNVDWLFREQLGFDLSGDLYRPETFSFDGSFAVGLEQDHFRETVNGDSDTDSHTGVLTTFDLTGRFFQSGALHGEVYARRSQDRIPRRFLPSIDQERTLYGTSLFLRSDIVPMRLTLERELLDWNGDADRFDQEETRETRLLYEADVLFSERHTLHFTYEYNNLYEEIAGGDYSFRTRRHELTLDDEFLFGDERQHRLDTRLRLQQEEGDLARDLGEFNPRLTLKHTPNLTSLLTYQFLNEQYDRLGFQSHRADYTLVHQFYKSLTTTFNLFGQHEDYDDGLLADTFGTGLWLTYVKKNPLGTFRSEFGYQWDQRVEHAGTGAYIQVRESATFRDPRPVFLSHPYVNAATITVTSTDRQRLFLFGRDYWITYANGRAALHRSPGGKIADGDSVLVFYAYRRLTRSRIDTQRVDYRIEQQFTFGLRPYYELGFRKQELAQPIGLVYEKDDMTRHRLGVEYAKDRWSVGVEYETEDNAYGPFDAIHVNGQWTAWRDARLDTAVSVNYSRFYFDSPDERDVDLLDIGWDTTLNLNERTSGNVLAAYRWENDSVDGVTQGVDLTAGLSHRIGATQIELTAEYDLLEIDGSPDDGFTFWLKVRRNLGALIR